MDTEEKESKPIIETKTSMEILSELFSTFHAEPPIIIKEEKSSESRKHKKKKKHKNKEKKHKKKSKKRKRSSSTDKSDNDSSSEINFDLTKLLVKEEKESDAKKIKIEGTDLSLSLNKIKDIQLTIDEKEEKPVIEGLSKNDEEGELCEEDTKRHTKHKKHKSKHKHKKDVDKGKSKKLSENDPSTSLCERVKDGHKSEDWCKSKDDINSFYKSRDREEHRRSRSPHKYTDSRHKEKHDCREYRDIGRRSRYSPFYVDDFYRPRERNKSLDRTSQDNFYKSWRSRSFERNKDDRWHNKRSWDHSKDRRYRDRCSPETESSHIDKKKLLEIARRNAIQMMKSGSLPGALNLGQHAQEKVIAAIKAGGKTIEELTDFCKTLSTKEDLGELSDVDEDKGSDSDNDKPFNHPFQIKDRPTTITMNIKNSVPLPIKSTQERTSELRIQFPVSSGQHHRKNENEWVPVEPKKDIVVPTPKTSLVLTKEIVPITPVLPPVVISPVTSMNPTPTAVPVLGIPQSSIDISAIVSQRLTAMRKLQENPHDVQALSQMYRSTKEVQSWAESKQQPGQFTGSVGGNFLSQTELSSGYQAWAKKDQLQVAAPVSGGMGMHLLQKMGWKPGEGLGKEKSGTLEPLLLEVKLDKKGLVANEEQKKKKLKQMPMNPKSSQAKHPVSLLGEYACKNKLGVPKYDLCFECGPDHKKNFLFKVTLNGMEFQPNVASPNKKEAKANAATLCLQKLGIIA